MASSTTARQIIDVVTPSAGESVSEGTILEWHVAVGDAVALDDTIVEISTDKVDVELPSPASGTVIELLVAEGDTVTVGQVIARIAVGDAESDGAALNGRSDDYLRNITMLGGSALSKSAMMPPYGKMLTQEEIADVIAFARAIAQPAYQAPVRPGSSYSER